MGEADVGIVDMRVKTLARRCATSNSAGRRLVRAGVVRDKVLEDAKQHRAILATRSFVKCRYSLQKVTMETIFFADESLQESPFVFGSHN